MKGIKLSHIVVAALTPLLLLTLIFCVYQSLKHGELNLVGILFAVYLLIPVVIFTLLYVSVAEWLIGLNFKSLLASLLWRIMLAIILGLLVLTMWVLFDGGMYKYNKMGFGTYWFQELNRYRLIIFYFGITIPVILKFIVRNRKPNGK